MSTFKEKYLITPRFLPVPSKRRNGRAISPAVKFLVAHDTGNAGSTAAGNVKFYDRTANSVLKTDNPSASAHFFVDDKEILECVPVVSAPSEMANHVLRNTPGDNQMFGFNANDAAIGVEYCFGTNIDAAEAYRKYVWLFAFLCFKFNLDPKSRIIGHAQLDPGRKIDPQNGLSKSGRSYEQFLRDVVAEYQECSGQEEAPAFVTEPGTVRTTVKLNIRKGAPNRRAATHQMLMPNTDIETVGFVSNGEAVNNNSKWFQDVNGNFFWSGGVIEIQRNIQPDNTLNFIEKAGQAIITKKLNVRENAPSTAATIVQTLAKNTTIKYIGFVTNGEIIQGNSKWFRDLFGNFFWSGGVTEG